MNEDANRSDKASPRADLREGSGRCPLCGGSGVYLFDANAPCKISVQYSLQECSSCGVSYTSPRPSQADLDLIYSAEYWDVNGREGVSSGKKSLVSRFNLLRQRWSIKPLLSLLPTGSRVLDVGCGAGQLAEILLKHGLCVEVTEFSERMLRSVMGRLKVKAYKGNLEDLDIDPGFDAIVFNNVLEHVPAPIENMQTAYGLLKPGGYIYIEVPNIASLQFSAFQKRWYPLDIPTHLTHFSTKTLDALAQRVGLNLFWRSFFSLHSSMAGIVVSAFPAFDPRAIRGARGLAKVKLILYFGLQMIALPLALFEAMLGRGGSMRTIYEKPNEVN